MCSLGGQLRARMRIRVWPFPQGVVPLVCTAAAHTGHQEDAYLWRLASRLSAGTEQLKSVRRTGEIMSVRMKEAQQKVSAKAVKCAIRSSLAPNKQEVVRTSSSCSIISIFVLSFARESRTGGL